MTTMPHLWRIEGDDDLRISLHKGQAAAWESRRRHNFIIAGTQGGKTSFGPWWLNREIYDSDLGRGAGDYIAVTASYDLFKLKMLPELRTVFEQVLGVGRYWSGDKVIELRDPSTGRFLATHADDPMWGRIILRSAQSKGGLEAATAKAAWLDECGQDDFTLEDWEAVQRRLSLAEGRVLGTTTPYNLGWLKGEVYDRWRDGDPDLEVINFPSYINPAFPRREYDRARTRMQGWRFSMFYDGLFTRPAGLIYDCFTDAMLVDPFPIPRRWRRAVGVDFGGANTAILWLAQAPETARWHVYREWLGGGLTSAEYAAKAREGLPSTTDEDAEEGESLSLQAYGGASSEGQYRLDWSAGGFHLAEPPVKEVEAGIDRVTELIKTDRLRVFRTCKGLRDELGSYRRKLDSAGNPMDEIEDKRMYHRLDALRYVGSGLASPTWLI